MSESDSLAKAAGQLPSVFFHGQRVNTACMHDLYDMFGQQHAPPGWGASRPAAVAQSPSQPVHTTPLRSPRASSPAASRITRCVSKEVGATDGCDEMGPWDSASQVGGAQTDHQAAEEQEPADQKILPSMSSAEVWEILQRRANPVRTLKGEKKGREARNTQPYLTNGRLDKEDLKRLKNHIKLVL